MKVLSKLENVTDHPVGFTSLPCFKCITSQVLRQVPLPSWVATAASSLPPSVRNTDLSWTLPRLTLERVPSSPRPSLAPWAQPLELLRCRRVVTAPPCLCVLPVPLPAFPSLLGVHIPRLSSHSLLSNLCPDHPEGKLPVYLPGQEGPSRKGTGPAHSCPQCPAQRRAGFMPLRMGKRAVRVGYFPVFPVSVFSNADDSETTFSQFISFSYFAFCRWWQMSCGN